MKQLQLWLNKFDFPKIVLAKKIWRNVRDKQTLPVRIHKLLTNDTRAQLSATPIGTSYITTDMLDVGGIDVNTARYLCRMYCSHRFDLLGSGWVSVNYHAAPLGVEGRKYDSKLRNIKFDNAHEWLNDTLPQSYLVESKKLCAHLTRLNKNYVPIDWHRDFKSGFRFDSQQTLYTQYGQVVGEGIDIKVPWELGRLQHLPQLAVFAKLLPEDKDNLIMEFCCQMYDFMALNPPGIGVNWACTMDAGIRVANMLVAYDIFCQLDTASIISNTFKQELANYVYSHGDFICGHLEYQEGMGSNHYLSNVAGLLFVASYLSPTAQTDNWWWLATQEFVNETHKQFFDEGSNFEGSTCYHRLSTEIIAYSAALLCGLQVERWERLQSHTVHQPLHEPFIDKTFVKEFGYSFDRYLKAAELHGRFKSLITRIFRAAIFTKHITKHNGDVTQIGDNDSGRFMKFSPCGKMLANKNAEEQYANLDGYTTLYGDGEFWDENALNHSTLLSAANGLFHADYFKTETGNFPLECSLIKCISKTHIKDNSALKQIIADEHNYRVGTVNKGNKFPVDESTLSYKSSTTFSSHIENDIINDNLQIEAYDEFGVVVARSGNMFLSIACGANKKYIHSWGHTHNDKLSIELQISGRDILLDPGTYIYTPLPAQRNIFRSVHNHNTMSPGSGEQNWWFEGKKGLFKMMRQTEINILKATGTEIKIALRCRGIIQVRQILFFAHHIVVNDFGNKPFVNNWNKSIYSNGYGKKINPRFIFGA